jgi:hypothetical protein
MPHRHIFHVADAASLGGLAVHHQGPVALARGHRIVDRQRIVTVHLDAVPAEGAEFVDHWIEARMGDMGEAEALHVVVVDEGDEIAHLQRRRHQGRFPGRAFLYLAIRQNGVDVADAASR